MEKISIDREKLEETAAPIIHLLPCQIMYDGKSNVTSYFTNTITQTSSHLDLDETKESESISNIFICEPTKKH